jgi:hypothetical protein
MNNYESAYNIPGDKKTKTKHITAARKARKQGTQLCNFLENIFSSLGVEDHQQIGQRQTESKTEHASESKDKRV